MQSFSTYLTGFISTCTLIYLFSPLAHRVGLVDAPGGHKHHRGTIPLVGGLAMFCGFVFAVLTLEEALTSFRPLFAGAGILVIIGVLDDFHELQPKIRFLAQIGAGLLMTLWGGQVITSLGPLVSEAEATLGPWAVPFTLFSVVGVINAVNMSDGLDGLAASLAFLGFLVLGYAALTSSLHAEAKIAFTFAAVVLAFLCFNVPLPGRSRALAFMGDAGSMLLGFGLSWLLVGLTQGPARPIAPVTALWLLALPLMDTVCIMFRRVLVGRSPFAADREHLHHGLLALGFTSSAVLLAMIALSALAATVGIAGQGLGVPDRMMFAAFLCTFVVYCLTMSLLWKRIDHLGRR